MAKRGASAIPDVDTLAIDRARAFTLPAAHRAALVRRLAQKGVPADAAELIADTVQAECRKHLARLVYMPADLLKPRKFPDADAIAEALAEDREQYERIHSLAAELAEALAGVAGELASGNSTAGKFAVKLAWDANPPAAFLREADNREALITELHGLAPAALDAVRATLTEIQAAAAFAMPPAIDPGARGHEFTRLVIAIRAHLEWALPAESAARRAHERRPSAAKSPLAQCFGIAIDAMRAAGHEIPEHPDVSKPIRRILADYAKGEANLAAQFGQNGASRAG